MDKKTINKRFIDCIEYVLWRESNSNKGEISEKIGIRANTFSEILKLRMNVATDHIANFIMAYPYISGEWILSGKGEMLKKDQREILRGKSSDVPDHNDIVDISFRLGEQTNENKHLIEKNLLLTEKIKKLEAEMENLEKYKKTVGIDKR